MNYAVVIHKHRKSDYGVNVPDLPGCVSAGASIDEALAMVREAIELHLEGIIEEGGLIPLPTPVEKLRGNPEYADGTWAIVNVDESTLRVISKQSLRRLEVVIGITDRAEVDGARLASVVSHDPVCDGSNVVVGEIAQVYFVDRVAHIECIDPTSGKAVWTADLQTLKKLIDEGADTLTPPRRS